MLPPTLATHITREQAPTNTCSATISQHLPNRVTLGRQKDFDIEDSWTSFGGAMDSELAWALRKLAKHIHEPLWDGQGGRSLAQLVEQEKADGPSRVSAQEVAHALLFRMGQQPLLPVDIQRRLLGPAIISVEDLSVEMAQLDERTLSVLRPVTLFLQQWVFRQAESYPKVLQHVACVWAPILFQGSCTDAADGTDPKAVLLCAVLIGNALNVFRPSLTGTALPQPLPTHAPATPQPQQQALDAPALAHPQPPATHLPAPIPQGSVQRATEAASPAHDAPPSYHAATHMNAAPGAAPAFSMEVHLGVQPICCSTSLGKQAGTPAGSRSLPTALLLPLSSFPPRGTLSSPTDGWLVPTGNPDTPEGVQPSVLGVDSLAGQPPSPASPSPAHSHKRKLLDVSLPRQACQQQQQLCAHSPLSRQSGSPSQATADAADMAGGDRTPLSATALSRTWPPGSPTAMDRVMAALSGGAPTSATSPHRRGGAAPGSPGGRGGSGPSSPSLSGPQILLRARLLRAGMEGLTGEEGAAGLAVFTGGEEDTWRGDGGWFRACDQLISQTVCGCLFDDPMDAVPVQLLPTITTTCRDSAAVAPAAAQLPSADTTCGDLALAAAVQLPTITTGDVTTLAWRQDELLPALCDAPAGGQPSTPPSILIAAMSGGCLSMEIDRDGLQVAGPVVTPTHSTPSRSPSQAHEHHTSALASSVQGSPSPLSLAATPQAHDYPSILASAQGGSPSPLPLPLLAASSPVDAAEVDPAAYGEESLAATVPVGLATPPGPATDPTSCMCIISRRGCGSPTTGKRQLLQRKNSV